MNNGDWEILFQGSMTHGSIEVTIPVTLGGSTIDIKNIAVHEGVFCVTMRFENGFWVVAADCAVDWYRDVVDLPRALLASFQAIIFEHV